MEAIIKDRIRTVIIQWMGEDYDPEDENTEEFQELLCSLTSLTIQLIEGNIKPAMKELRDPYDVIHSE